MLLINSQDASVNWLLEQNGLYKAGFSDLDWASLLTRRGALLSDTDHRLYIAPYVEITDDLKRTGLKILL